MFRSDAAELLGSDDASLLARQTTTLAELLSEARWRPRPGDGGVAPRAGPSPRCTVTSTRSWASTRTPSCSSCGVDVDVLDDGCCGLAGNFGFERGHYDVSMACAEHGLFPAVREAGPGTAILADGFSCRTQIERRPHRPGRDPPRRAARTRHPIAGRS